MKQVGTTVSLFFLLVNPFFSFALAPKYSNEFLQIGVGARSLAMGNSVIASTDDATAIFTNPSLLGFQRVKFKADLMHAEHFAGIVKYDFGGATYQLDSTLTIGGGLIRMGIDNILNTTDLIDQNGNVDYDKISYFSAADYALLISGGKAFFNRNLVVGATAKVIYRNIGKFANGYGIGIDVSSSYRWSNYKFAIVAKDITTTFNLWSIDNSLLEIPTFVLPSGDSTSNINTSSSVEITLPQLLIGASRYFPLPKEFDVLLEINLQATFDGKRNTPFSGSLASLYPQAGIEIGYSKLAYLRIGVNNLQRHSLFDNKTQIAIQPNGGIGVKYKGFSVDYALTNIARDGINAFSHIVSLSYSMPRY